jgi:AcrR family transcriptional regulator/DNA-binding transcriptional ArsR family regulator
VERLDSDPACREAVALGLVDAVLEADDGTLGVALDALRDARAHAGAAAELSGWLDAAIAFAHWGLERVPSQPAVARGTQAHDFLSVLDGSPRLGSAELRRLLEVDETQVSRTGRRLLELGLVTRRKVGRQVFWELTPRGQRAFDEAPTTQRSPHSEFWQAALRSGFQSEPEDVDPTRKRIIEKTLELHTSHGIQATTWPQIAQSAGVPEETVKEMFPTLDDLVRSCGAHFMGGLRLPSEDLAPEVFAGASSDDERIHRMVETFFGAYERGADGITAARRERNDVPALDEAMEELDHALDAVVTEAIGPQRPDSSSVASLKALTDVEVWRALRDHGATPEAAVDQASAAVERWLAAHPG